MLLEQAAEARHRRQRHSEIQSYVFVYTLSQVQPLHSALGLP